ncbi:MAG: RNA polymerase sporulation sigma factor SigK [Clostridia bacterium]|nr:RNA polymerase sporulation sigma factor SigK [Clostridia bacterium]
MDILFIIASFFSFFILNADTTNQFPPPLDKERERKLFIEYRQEKSEQARSLLIEHNLRLVAHIVRKYYGTSDMSDDLVSIGTIGLIKAVDSFNVKKGARFATYAAKCIQNEILMFFRRKKKSSSEISINSTIDTDRDGNSLTYMDVIKCDDTIADDLDMKMKINEAMKYINYRLNTRERSIIKLRYGLNGTKPLTQRETSERLGISRSYVSRIEKCALEKIAAYLNGREL